MRNLLVRCSQGADSLFFLGCLAIAVMFRGRGITLKEIIG
jgi:hypothetical protein